MSTMTLHARRPRRHRLVLLLAACAALGLAWPVIRTTAAAEGGSPAGKPNFLVIVADDMGFSDAGCYGGEIATPNLDRLAAGGLRFTQMYSTARCWPSRTCILTGYYAQQVRMDPPQGRLPAWARVAPHYLKPLGYRCYHSGKWHLHGAPRAVADGGFDRSYKLDDHDRFFAPRAHTEDDRPLPPVPPDSGHYVTTGIAEHAIRCLKQHAADHAGQPFFEYLAFTCPHFPLHALPEDIARYRDRYLEGWDAVRARRHGRMREMGIIDCGLSPLDPATAPGWNLSAEDLRKRIGPGEAGRAVAWQDLSDEQKRFQATKMAIHAAMIDRMDREIGRVLEQVKAMGAFENTVVLFVSDNGASAEQIIRGDGHDPAAPPGSAKSYLCLGPGWSTAANTPFRLHKSWVHEGGTASPLIVHWPAGIRDRGQLRHAPGHFIDLLPTLLELAGADAPGPWNGHTPPPLPGRSLVPALAKDAAIPRDYLYWHHMNNRAVRAGDWKLVSAGGKPGEGPWELYDLRADRCETKDLAAQHPERVKQLAALWQKCEDQFRAQAGPPDPAKPAKTAKPARPGKPGAGKPRGRVERSLFGRMPDGAEVHLFTLSNARGLEAQVMTLGATLVSMKLPDRNGRFDNVNLRLDTLDDYQKGHPLFGSVVGRYANRIAGAKFAIDGVEHQLTANAGPHHIHGGSEGAFHRAVWKAEPVQDPDGAGVRLTLSSPDGQDGYPGRLEATVLYKLTGADELILDYSAKTDKPTHVNLTNHAYWNLAGAGSGDVLGQELTLNAGQYLPADKAKIPSGEIKDVHGTPMDFTEAKTIGSRIEQVEDGNYDHCYVVRRRPDERTALAARVADPKSGRVMEVWTTQPGFQLYTAKGLSDRLKTGGKPYGPYHGVCIETQHYPDAPNRPQFPSTLLRPGETYHEVTIHRFMVEKAGP